MLETHRGNRPFILVENEEGFQEESLYPHEFPVFDRLVVQGYLRRKQAFIDSLDREDAAYIALGLEPPPDVDADGKLSLLFLGPHLATNAGGRRRYPR